MVDVGTTDRIDWLGALVRGLERVGVAVLAARACSGEAALILDPEGAVRPGQRALRRWPEGVLEITIDRGEGPCFARVGELRVAYRQRGEGGARTRRALAIVTRLLGGIQGGARRPLPLESPLLHNLEVLEPAMALNFAFPFCTAERVRDDAGQGERVGEVLVRVTGRCNQRCPFCSAPVPRADPTFDALKRLFELVDAVTPASTLTLTGGEPTLRHDFPKIVEHALAGSQQRDVEIQTNGVRLAKQSRVEALPRSDRLRFFLSLHSMREASYDRCTGTKGLLEAATAGVDNLLRAGHRVILSVVATGWNSDELVDLVESVARRFGEHGPNLPSMHFSIMLCPDHRQGVEDSLVRYSEVAPILVRAEERAEELGLTPESLSASTHAAIPPCFLSPRHQSALLQSSKILVEPVVDDAPSMERGWHKAVACQSCVAGHLCRGLPARYVERFGDDEIRPIRR